MTKPAAMTKSATKTAAKRPTAKVVDEWVSLRDRARHARSVEDALRQMVALHSATVKAVAHAREQVATGKASAVFQAKRDLQTLLVEASRVFDHAKLAGADRLRDLPMYYDESHPFTRAHRLVEAYDAMLQQTIGLKSAISRATVGDAAQVTAAVDRLAALVEVPVPAVACGCAHPAATLRQVTEPGVAEPLLAVAEYDAVYGGGTLECDVEYDKTILPSSIRVDRVRVSAEGASLVREGEGEVPSRVAAEWKRSGCLPWVKIARDPVRFGACMKRARAIGPVDSADKIFRLLKDDLAKEDQEVFIVVCLDTTLHIRGLTELARGARDHAQVPVPDVLRLALVEGASAVILVHNHPSGHVKPSDGDREVTKLLHGLLSNMRIQLVDHVIVGHSAFYSFADHKLL